MRSSLIYEFPERVAEILDSIRSQVIRLTTKSLVLRRIFYRRGSRLAALFCGACTVSLTFALIYPLWMLLIGPLVYGIPHIYASARYVHFALTGGDPETRGAQASRQSAGDPQLTENRIRQGHRFFRVVALFLIGVASYRIFVTLNLFRLDVSLLSEWTGSTYLELIALGFTFISGAMIYRLSAYSAFRGLATLLPFLFVFLLHPVETIGAMVLVHNFVGFAFWIQGAKINSERAVAWIAFFIVLLLTAGIFHGDFDGIYQYMKPGLSLDFANMSVVDTGRLIAPSLASQGGGEASSKLWLHATVAFAFGQSMHYFVWLKAIPDQFHYHEVPTSFRQSLRLLERDFGRLSAHLALGVSIGAIVFWSFLSFQTARFIYFALASYHGYLEIAGLALALGQILNRKLERVNRSQIQNLG